MLSSKFLVNSKFKTTMLSYYTFVKLTLQYQPNTQEPSISNARECQGQSKRTKLIRGRYFQNDDCHDKRDKRLVDIYNHHALHKHILQAFPELFGKTYNLYWIDIVKDRICIENPDDFNTCCRMIPKGEYLHVIIERTLSSKDSCYDFMRYDILCDGCNNRLFGSRFKCIDCEDYDLCDSCFGKTEHSLYHTFKLLYNPHDYYVFSSPLKHDMDKRFSLYQSESYRAEEIDEISDSDESENIKTEVASSVFEQFDSSSSALNTDMVNAEHTTTSAEPDDLPISSQSQSNSLNGEEVPLQEMINSVCLQLEKDSLKLEPQKKEEPLNDTVVVSEQADCNDKMKTSRSPNPIKEVESIVAPILPIEDMTESQIFESVTSVFSTSAMPVVDNLSIEYDDNDDEWVEISDNELFN